MIWVFATRSYGFPESFRQESFVLHMIRTFCNADVPALTDVWRCHWSLVTPTPAVTVAMVEQAILSRTFFDASRLLVADVNGRLQAWCHFAANVESAVICAICARPDAAAEVCDDLLAATLQQIGAAGFGRVEAGLVRDDQFGYAGLAPIGHGIGIPESDTRISNLLTEQGFIPGKQATRMTVSTGTYRMPVSREALQFRRSTTFRCETPTLESTRQASAMAHFDIEHHQLLDRDGRQLASVDLWCSDPEAEVMSSDHAILDIHQAQQRGQLEPAEAFLVATVLQSQPGRHIFEVETSVDREQSVLCDQLKSLHFREQARGAVWTRDLG